MRGAADDSADAASKSSAGFILLECCQPHRDADTWNRMVAQATQGLPVSVVQVTSDEARGLVAHARDGLGAQHSPDLMHAQQELHRATSLPLQRQAQQAPKHCLAPGIPFDINHREFPQTVSGLIPTWSA